MTFSSVSYWWMADGTSLQLSCMARSRTVFTPSPWPDSAPSCSTAPVLCFVWKPGQTHAAHPSREVSELPVRSHSPQSPPACAVPALCKAHICVSGSAVARGMCSERHRALERQLLLSDSILAVWMMGTKSPRPTTNQSQSNSAPVLETPLHGLTAHR